jgi:hypothetical protein
MPPTSCSGIWSVTSEARREPSCTPRAALALVRRQQATGRRGLWTSLSAPFHRGFCASSGTTTASRRSSTRRTWLGVTGRCVRSSLPCVANGCGGLAGKVELLSGTEGVSSRSVREDRAARVIVRLDILVNNAGGRKPALSDWRPTYRRRIVSPSELSTVVACDVQPSQCFLSEVPAGRSTLPALSPC